MQTTFVSALLGAVIGGAIVAFIPFMYTTSNEARIAEYYAIENAVHVSPHSVRKNINSSDMILVDLRSAEEYARAHIIGAVNIPAYSSPDTSDYGAVERIVGSFRILKEEHPNAEIVVYCYSNACMTGRKVGAMLAEHDIYVKHLGIGWNEWRYSWDLWNHDGETKVNPSDYIATGTDPGVFHGIENKPGCPISGDLGC